MTRSASCRTSSATTANPRPCSPARAASIAAFKARRFVWAAMSSITETILPISADFSPRSETRVLTEPTASAMRSIPSIVFWTASTPLPAASFARFAPSEAFSAFSVTPLAASATSETIASASLIAIDCCSEPVRIASTELFIFATYSIDSVTEAD